MPLSVLTGACVCVRVFACVCSVFPPGIWRWWVDESTVALFEHLLTSWLTGCSVSKCVCLFVCVCVCARAHMRVCVTRYFSFSKLHYTKGLLATPNYSNGTEHTFNHFFWWVFDWWPHHAKQLNLLVPGKKLVSSRPVRDPCRNCSCIGASLMRKKCKIMLHYYTVTSKKAFMTLAQDFAACRYWT